MTVAAPEPHNVLGVVYSVNGAIVGAVTTPPFTISYVPTTPGAATLKATFQLSNGSTVETSVSFVVQ